MSSFEDYNETIEYDNEKLIIYFKTKIGDNFYYICDGYRVFKNDSNMYEEVIDKKVLQQIQSMITLKKD